MWTLGLYRGPHYEQIDAMTSEQEEAQYWASQTITAHRGELEWVRTSATKWQAGIAAFLGVYATVGFVTGPSTLATLPVSDWIRIPILFGLCLAGVAAITATFKVLAVSAGLPKPQDGYPLTGVSYFEQVRDGAIIGSKKLKSSKRWAAIAGSLVLASSMGILAAGVIATTPAAKAILVTTKGTYCGPMSTVKGVVYLTINGKLMSAKNGALTLVPSC